MKIITHSFLDLSFVGPHFKEHLFVGASKFAHDAAFVFNNYSEFLQIAFILTVICDCLSCSALFTFKLSFQISYLQNKEFFFI